MYRLLTTWVIRNKSKTIYLVFGLTLGSLLLVNSSRNGGGSTENYTRSALMGVDTGQGSPGNNADLRYVTTDKGAYGHSNKSSPVIVLNVPFHNEYSRRQEEAMKACRDSLGSSDQWLDNWPGVKKEPKFLHDPMISTKTNLFYCPVGKVASSFFTRWVLAMNKPGPMTSPYDIAMKDAGRGRAESLMRSVPKEKRVDFLQQSIRVVFGRNPYSRIFSAYVDKLFSPNPFYWKIWGKRAVELDSVAFKNCGAEVTFAQFVNAVVKDIAKKDVHLIPVSKECNTCQLPYTVVGKLENTIDDLDYASKLLNISSSFQHEHSYKATAQKDVILDSVHSAFNWKTDIRRCGVSLDDMGRRMWRKLHIRGVIDTAIDYPLKPGSIDRLTSGAFIEICEKAIRNSTDGAKLKRQRKEAMKLAYASVPKALAAKIKEMYELDFSYFGYEKEADFISGMEATDLKETSVIFQLRTPWTVL